MSGIFQNKKKDLGKKKGFIHRKQKMSYTKSFKQGVPYLPM